MATIATAEVQVIADTSRFIPDLRRKLRTAFAGVGDDLGQRIENAVSSRLGRPLETLMARLGRNAGDEFNKSVTSRLENLDKVMGNAGRSAGQSYIRNFRAQADFRELTQEWARDAVQGTAWTTAGSRLARRFGDAFNTEIGRISFAPSPNPITIRRSQEFVDNLISTMVTRAQNRSRDVARAFESGLVELRNSQRAQQFVRDLIERMTDTGVEVAPDAGAEIAEAIATGVERASPQAASKAADEFVDDFETAMNNRLRTAFRRLTSFNEGFDGLNPAVQRSTRVLRSFTDSLINLTRNLTIVPLQNLGNLFSDFTTGIAESAAMALVFLGVLEQLSGLLFALPAATGLAAAGIAAMIVPLLGTKDAFSEAFGEAENFEDALGSLTAPAQVVARELRAIVPALRALQLAAQVAFFQELDGAITAVADNLLGRVQQGITAASGAFGALINQIAEFLAEAETAETVTAIFESLVGILEELADEVQPFLRGLRTLTNEFLPGLESIEGVLGGIGSAFERWVNEVTTGDLLSGISPAQRAFQEALETLEQLARITGNVSEAIGAFFEAGSRNSRTFLDLIEDITEGIAEAFSSPSGQETLAAFLDDLVQISDDVLGLIGAILEQFPKLAAAVAPITDEIGDDLERFLDNVGDGLQNLINSGGGRFFTTLAQELGDLDLAQLGAALGRVLGTLSTLLPLLSGLLDIAINIVDFISRIIFAIELLGRVQIDGLTRQFSDFGEFFESFGPRVVDGFQDRVEDLGEFLEEFWPRLQDGFDDWVQERRESWQQLWDDLTTTVTNFFSGLDLTGSLDGLTAAFTAWFEPRNVEWSAFWTGLIDSALIALGALGIDVSGSLNGLTSNFTNFEANLSQEWTAFWSDFTTTVSNALATARATFTNWQTGISTAWRNFWSGLFSFARSSLDGIRSIVSGAVSGIRSIINGFASGAASTWNSFWSGLRTTASNTITSIRSTISGALSSLQSAFSSFASNVRGVWNSLLSTIQSVASSIQSIVNRVAGAVSSAISAARSLGNIDLNPFANGGIVTRPTAALIGEAGPEVVIPLNRPQRAVDLIEQSGLLSLLAAQGAIRAQGTTSDGRPIEMHVHSSTADPDQVARKAMRLLERRMGGRGLERTT